jgi:CBS domain-containing protein
MTWTVSDVMTKNVVAVGPATSFKSCANLMRIHALGALPVVVGDDRLAGIVSEADLLAKEAQLMVPTGHRYSGGKAKAMTAGGLMTTDVVTTTADTPLAAAASLMFEHRVQVLPVVDSEKRLAGMVNRSQILKVFLRSDESIRREIVRALVDMPLIGRGDVDVEVNEGVAQLHGGVATGRLTEIVSRLVSSVPGVVGVQSHLTVSSELETAGADALPARLSGRRGVA